MLKKKLKFVFFIILILTISVPSLYSQNIPIDDFETYANVGSLNNSWKFFGFSTLDHALIRDTVSSPSGVQYIQYTYSGNAQTTWGGAIERYDLVSAPLNLTAASAGLQFVLKGDGTTNKIYVRISNGTSNWSSNFFPLADTNWHNVFIPFKVDTTLGFTNGTKTTTDLMTDLSNVTDFRIYVDHPVKDSIAYKIDFDAIYAMKVAPPTGIALENFEKFNSRSDMMGAIQFFGYSTADYYLIKDPVNAPEGFKYLDYLYKPGSNTTWGGAFREKALGPVDLSSMKAGVQFYMKGDGTNNRIYLRLDNGNEMWTSYFIPLKDTTWKLYKIGFYPDTLTGFRYVGNDPNNGPVFTSNIGTTTQIDSFLTHITGMRILVYYPTKDDILRHLYFDGIYAVNVFSDGTVVPVELTSFTANLNGNVINLNWTTATETNNKGFEIQRKINNERWETIGFKTGKGTSTNMSAYTFSDNIGSLSPGSLVYRLKQIDLDGSFKYSNEVEVQKVSIVKYNLSQNYPNPFNPSTIIKYSIEKSGLVTLKIYNILGKEIASLVNEVKPAGNYEVIFNANNLPAGRQGLSSGVYFYKLQSGSCSITKKFILMK